MFFKEHALSILHPGGGRFVVFSPTSTCRAAYMLSSMVNVKDLDGKREIVADAVPYPIGTVGNKDQTPVSVGALAPLGPQRFEQLIGFHKAAHTNFMVFVPIQTHNSSTHFEPFQSSYPELIRSDHGSIYTHYTRDVLRTPLPGAPVMKGERKIAAFLAQMCPNYVLLHLS